MRLLNARTMKLEEFFEKSIPKYAILSHTWGDDEVTFREFDPLRGPHRTSEKIKGCCTKTLEDDFEYVWIDTCCIDKSSSAELSEAINSMFAWYSKAEICYVYLSDVDSDQASSSDFDKSRWFYRGWTLQELLAPRTLVFYNLSWCRLGCLTKQGPSNPFLDESDLLYKISRITKIPSSFVIGTENLNTASIAMRMSWASARQTTRVEDMAYCLLGIFDIAMPMLYGEGTKAFMRLQEEIIKNEDDHSLLAWGSHGVVLGGTSCFATSPFEFAGCGALRDSPLERVNSAHVLMTNKGLNMEMSVVQLITGDYIGRLIDRSFECLAIPLVRHVHSGKEAIFYRPPLNIPQWVDPKFFAHVNPQSVYISKSTPKLDPYFAGIQLSPAFLEELQVTEVHPPNWNLSDGWCLMPLNGTLSLPQISEQMIFVGCNSKRGDMFVIKIDYSFVNRSIGIFYPGSVNLLASPMVSGESTLSLLELIAAKGHEVDKMLDWQENLFLKRLETFGSALLRNDYTRRLHLNRTNEFEWKIDLVNVSDSYGGEGLNRHFLGN